MFARAAQRFRLWEYLDGVGYLLHENLIDRESVYFMSQGAGTPMQWRKWRTVIEEVYRKPYNNPDWFFAVITMQDLSFILTVLIKKPSSFNSVT